MRAPRAMNPLKHLLSVRNRLQKEREVKTFWLLLPAGNHDRVLSAATFGVSQAGREQVKLARHVRALV